MEAWNNPVIRFLGQSKLVAFFFRSWVLAAMIGTFIYFLQDFKPDPYLITLTDASTYLADYTNSRSFYRDLDSDQASEMVTLSNLSDSECCLLVRTSQGSILDQWNFRGNFTIDLMKPMVSDFDADGKSEISVVTLDGYRMLLNIVEPYDTRMTPRINRLIDTIPKIYGEPYAYININDPVDLNQDGQTEILFSITSGFARQPRRVYAYDFRKDSLLSSPFSGSPIEGISLVDLDKDGRSELVCRSSATNSYGSEQIDYPDVNAWYFVFDQNLKYKRAPVKLGGPFVQVIPVFLPGDKEQNSFVLVKGRRYRVPFYDWYRIQSDYSLVKQDFPYGERFKNAPEYIRSADGGAGLLYNARGEAVFVNSAGKDYSANLFAQRSSPVEIQNADFGIKEFAYCFLVDAKSRSIVFYSESGERLGSIDKVSYMGSPLMNWIGKVNGIYQFNIAGGTSMQWFSVRANPWVFAQYGLWVLYILGCYLLIELIRLSAKSEFSKREKLHRELLQMQLLSFKNQLDPHFAFNALDGLSYLALNGDTEKVTNFIDRFSHLFRLQLQSSDKSVIRLRGEIEFLESYMALQQIRFGEEIRFHLDVDPEIDTNILVPKMILQSHVENALKHGIRPKLLQTGVKSGNIRVSVQPSGKSVLIAIEDDGVGRNHEHAEISESNGRGLQLLNQIYSAVYQLYHIKISQNFEDLRDESGQPRGTRVKIRISYR